jgi:hypothetical protein
MICLKRMTEMNYHSVPALAFVDGVFTPDGGGGPVTLDSVGHTTDILDDTGRWSWDAIWNGPVEAGSAFMDGVDYSAEGHSNIGFHANKGITFDLDAIEAAYPGKQIDRLTAMVGINDAGDFGSAHVRVYVDGVLKAEFLNLAMADPAHVLDLTINPNARFLTFVSTDANADFMYDDVTLGDPIPACDRSRRAGAGAGCGVRGGVYGAEPRSAGGVQRAGSCGQRSERAVRDARREFHSRRGDAAREPGLVRCFVELLGGDTGIFRIDDGVSTKLADLPFDTLGIGGLTFSQARDHLWYVVDPDHLIGGDGPIGPTLYRIDFDGTFTEIGEIGMSGHTEEFNFGAIAMNTTHAPLFAVDSESDTLYIIDTVTAGAAPAGALGFDLEAWVCGMDFTADDQHLLLAHGEFGELVKVNISTGAASNYIGHLGYPTSSISVVVPAPACPWDTAPAGAPDGTVGLGDLNALLSNWGACPAPCPYDFAPAGGDEMVGLGDLNALLSNWGPCP